MVRKFFLSTILAFSAVPISAQAIVEKSILKKLDKQKWQPVKTWADKALHKDTTNASARYILAKYFFDPRNPQFHIDSAYRYTKSALRDFSQTANRSRERLKRIPLDSVVLLNLKQQVNKAAFRRARMLNTEEGYIYFIVNFPDASERSEAIELRNAVAYAAAQKENTYQAFATFLQKYPGASEAPHARDLYHKLLYESHTSDKSLESYESFLRTYPSSPYRKETERQIFELSTVSGSEMDFLDFLKKYPNSSLQKKAKDILYHLLHEPGKNKDYLNPLMTDSLQKVEQLNEGYLVPFFKNGLFGLMDRDGKEVIPATLKEIDKNYVCGNVVEDVLVFDKKIMARNGAIVYEGKTAIEELDDIGSGFLSITTQGCIQVIHKSGFRIGEECYTGARSIAGRFIALQTEYGWTLRALSGAALLQEYWEEITEKEGVILLKSDHKLWMVKPNDLAVSRFGKVALSAGFDEVRSWPDGLIWARQGTKEGLFDTQLNIKIPVDEHSLTREFCGIRIVSRKGVKLYDLNTDETGYFQQVKTRRPWVAVQQMNKWRLFDPSHKKYLSDAYDTLEFVGLFPAAHKRDSVRIFLNEEKFLNFKKVSLEFISSKDSTSFLLVIQEGRKLIYDRFGEKLFTGDYDHVQYAEGGVFIVTKNGKKGLVTANGQVVLPIEMDAIGEMNGNLVPFLKGMKFGLLDLHNKRKINAAYDKNLVSYNDKYLIAFKNSAYGIIDWNNDHHTAFEYTGIMHWNDSAVFVKNKSHWQLLHITTKEVLMDHITSISLVSDHEKEKVAIIQQDNSFGVISNTKGIVIPTIFSDIINVGSKEVPMYFTEKHVEEASLFVVIYYNHKGELIRRQAFDVEEYERIYCDR